MLGLTDLLSAARLLADGEAGTEAYFRRAISTAYYALFHHVLRAGAERFLKDGKTDSAAYSVLYRGFSHGRMKAVCESLNAFTLNWTFARQFRRASVSSEMRTFASIFLALQEWRQLADYDPLVDFAKSDAEACIQDAEVAMAAFNRTEAAEQDDVLALMLTNARG